MSQELQTVQRKLQDYQDQFAIYQRDEAYRRDIIGMKQCWQERGEDNVDSTHPVILDIYIPPDTKLVNRAYLRLRLKTFRSYSQTAAAGGGTFLTSNNTNPWYLTPAVPLLPDFMEFADPHTHGDEVPPDGGYPHGMESVSHDHDITIPDHTHDIVRGIYEGTVASSVTVKINGTDRTAELGGPFSTDQAKLDITKYLTATGWNTIELGSETLGRIHATVFVEIYLS